MGAFGIVEVIAAAAFGTFALGQISVGSGRVGGVEAKLTLEVIDTAEQITDSHHQRPR